MKDLFASPARQSAERRLQLTDQQRLDWLRLCRSENVGPRTFQSLLNRFGGAAAALDALPEMLRSKGGRTITLCSVAEAEKELSAIAQGKARLIARGEADYPPALAAIDASPPLITVKGNVGVLQKPFVAIVGSRNASAVGLKMAEKLAVGLNEAGFAIVSGLARGIDTRTHHASLRFGTVGVLAGGIDKPYPPENLKLLEEMLEHGAVIAEMPMGWEPRGRDFPRRNRIISGLAYGTIIVEAARKSGSLITARFALEQNREVFAVPGSPLDPRAEGANDLIRQGATLVTGAQDVVAVLAPMLEQGPPAYDSYMNDDGSAETQTHLDEPLWDELDLPGIAAAPQVAVSRMEAFEEPARPAPDVARVAATETINVPNGEAKGSAKDRILLALGPSPVELDDIMRAANVSLRDVHSTLLDLELEGRIERHGGNRVSLL
ncbi:MAG: DNA-processing protein DprA [Beijerinckiaceae bacterium]|nr:DNA-processing protein DprA [Beijerinckiaceae bacterium]